MTNQLTKILGFNLRNYLKLADASQAFLARRIRRSVNTIQNYVHGRTLPDLKTVNLIRAEFGFDKLTELPKVKAKTAAKAKTAKKTAKKKSSKTTITKVQPNVYKVTTTKPLIGGKVLKTVPLTKKWLDQPLQEKN